MPSFDPNANAQFLLSGVHTGTAIAEQRRREQRDRFISVLEAEEAQQRRMIFEQQQQAAKAAQQFQADEYASLTGQPAFNQAADAMTAGDPVGLAQGMGKMAQVHAQQPLFAQLPPQLQQHYLEPLQKEAKIRERRRSVEDWANENFPGPQQADMRYAILDDWDARNMHNLPESTIHDIQNNRPINMERFRMQLVGLGVHPDQINNLVAASIADRAGVPASYINQTFRPQFDPAQYRTELAQSGIPDEAANTLHAIALASGRKPPAGVVNTILRGGTLDEQSLQLIGYTPDEARGIAQLYADTKKIVRPVVTQASIDENDRRFERGNAEHDRRTTSSNAEYDRRMAERAKLRQMAPTNDANYIRLKGLVDSYQREVDNQARLGNREYVQEAMRNLWSAEEALDNYLRGIAQRRDQTSSPRGTGAPSGAPSPSTTAPANDQQGAVPAPRPAASGAQPTPAASVAQLTMRQALAQAQQELAPGATKEQIQAMREQIKARAQQIMAGNAAPPARPR